MKGQIVIPGEGCIPIQRCQYEVHRYEIKLLQELFTYLFYVHVDILHRNVVIVYLYQINMLQVPSSLATTIGAKRITHTHTK